MFDFYEHKHIIIALQTKRKLMEERGADKDCVEQMLAASANTLSGFAPDDFDTHGGGHNNAPNNGAPSGSSTTSRAIVPEKTRRPTKLI